MFKYIIYVIGIIMVIGLMIIEQPELSNKYLGTNFTTPKSLEITNDYLYREKITIEKDNLCIEKVAMTSFKTDLNVNSKNIIDYYVCANGDLFYKTIIEGIPTSLSIALSPLHQNCICKDGSVNTDIKTIVIE